MASYRKRGSTWSYRISYKDNGEFKVKEKGGFRTKTEAKIEAEEIEKKLLQNINVFEADTPIWQFMEIYYLKKKKDKIGTHSQKAYERDIRRVKEFFGDKYLSSLNNLDYQEFIDWFAEKHAKETVSKLHSHLKLVVRYAFRNGLIPIDPSHEIDIHGNKPEKSKELKYLSEHEVNKLLDVLNNGFNPSMTSRFALLLGVFTGARIGELLALKFEDYNHENDTISINKSFDYHYTKEVKSTKSLSSNRIIKLDKGISDKLAWFITYKKREKLINNRNPDNYLLAYGDKPITLTSVNKTLKRACTKAGIKNITVHALRHTHASILLHNQLSIEYISERLGHSSPEITRKYYIHIIDELRQDNDNRMNSVFCKFN
ncbi:tyrosine-type recombinase/integrase [Facklamia sp. P13064]|uniref:tyrosine-type recombinase/integrase n=1 Tax=Facklamia sp. P13064 TaxID=3421953 RepID=UPI003D181A77